ncbi:uncharacterized protein BO88DRAFT_449229 [Aspergillus vadensis CBS 113365]|uniref:Uncharacterized protein n=1 Tax=Aspergillus vadensis (strain CBS 113365 / IMI 142717 / IBT 24658) TaxID=1448311 RepID=A0A319BKW9_ASPVC|nr:hypothetical protein BO88DRAFT_449229 [Aspergillus vadensis CBS 113365]PYH73345.1 hypothetical protein BO88DRAFT_449229 [Aspergillus vadensis CBS 113365]
MTAHRMICFDSSGFRGDLHRHKVIIMNAAWGLGENIIQDTVDQDEYQFFKLLVSEGYFVSIIDVDGPEIPSSLDGPAPLNPITIAPWTWNGAKDSLTSDSFIVHARPETVHSRRDATAALKAYNIGHKGCISNHRGRR